MVDAREGDEAEEKEEHLIEVITDADHAGNRNDRKSATSFQIFTDGNLMELRVRTQKSLALSSGESKFVAVVAGCSDGLLIRHLWMQMTGEGCQMKVRSDSSAVRAMVQRQGIGRVRHLDASLLWAQQKEKEKVLATGAIPTELNCADIGAKNLTRKRLFGLLYMLKVVNAAHDRVGEDEFKELEHEERMKRATKKILKDRTSMWARSCCCQTYIRLRESLWEKDMLEERSHRPWIIFVVCAALGALTTMEWLWRYVKDIFLGMVWNYVAEAMVTKTQENNTYEKVEKISVETQADCWIDMKALQAYEWSP